ncbi:unnamed protein product [Rangifer tarandus platyrhynchus]|uniref:Uncharacterized protein n=1 Tax=Rangifer tarandus platyrhynchus TaxID=3082113 RepID=A0AC60AAB7_RANTA
MGPDFGPQVSTEVSRRSREDLLTTPRLLSKQVPQLIESTGLITFLPSWQFEVYSWEMKTLSITPFNLEISSIAKDTSRRTLFSLSGKAPAAANLPLCCQTPENRLLDSCNTSKESTRP